MPPYLPSDAPSRPLKETPIPLPAFLMAGAGASGASQSSKSAMARTSVLNIPVGARTLSPGCQDCKTKVDVPTYLLGHDELTRPSPRSGLGSGHIVSQTQPTLSVPNVPLTPTRCSRIEVVLSNTPRTASLTKPPRAKSEDLEDELIVSDITPRQLGRNTMKFDSIPASTPALPISKPHPDEATAAPGAETDPPKKRRGRPKGWRPGMPYSSSGAPTPSGSLKRADRRDGNAPNYALKQRRKGRHARKPSPTPEQIYASLQPRYIPFLCEWKGCPAELHNAETLRKHVYIVHGRSKKMECKWAKCGYASARPTFSSKDEFEHHMEERHLVPFVWHVGDGPEYRTERNEEAQTSDSLPDYLFDETGKQVTPSVKGQEVEDFITWRNNRRRLRALNQQRDANAPYEDDHDVDEM